MKQIWETELSRGDIANGNIRFASSTLTIEPEYFGGTNDKEPAAKRLQVQFGSSPPTAQWLYGDKKIFANRNPYTKDFFSRISATEGTRLRVTKTDPNFLHIEKA